MIGLMFMQMKSDIFSFPEGLQQSGEVHGKPLPVRPVDFDSTRRYQSQSQS